MTLCLVVTEQAVLIPEPDGLYCQFVGVRDKEVSCVARKAGACLRGDQAIRVETPALMMLSLVVFDHYQITTSQPIC